MVLVLLLLCWYHCIQVIIKYVFGVSSNVIPFLPNFMKNGEIFKELKCADIAAIRTTGTFTLKDRQTDRQTDTHIRTHIDVV